MSGEPQYWHHDMLDMKTGHCVSKLWVYTEVSAWHRSCECSEDVLFFLIYIVLDREHSIWANNDLRQLKLIFGEYGVEQVISAGLLM